MLITYLKTKLSQKTHTQTQIIFLPQNFTIGQFTQTKTTKYACNVLLIERENRFLNFSALK